MIVTFLALLEMIRLKLVRVFQPGSFGPIRVYKRARLDDAPTSDRLIHDAPTGDGRRAGRRIGDEEPRTADRGLSTED